MANLSSLDYGSHILWVYRDEREYKTILKRLIEEGLTKGERIVFIGSEEDVCEVSEIIRSQNEIIYLIPEKDIDELIKNSRDIFKSFYTRVISTIDETSKKQLKELLITSANIDKLCEDNIIWICAYNITRLEPISLLHLVQAHPYLMRGEEILENFIFIPQEKVVNGTTVDILTSIVDILKEGERYRSDLKATLDLYKALFEATGTATVVIEDTIITSVNEAFELLTGFSKEEIVGKKTWMDFIPFQSDLEKMLRYRELRLKDPSLAPKSYETRIRDKLGNIKEVMLTVNIIPGTGKFIASLFDITEIKRINKALRILSFANQELIRAKGERELVEEIANLLKNYEDYQDVRIELEDSRVKIVLDKEVSSIERDIFDKLSKDIEYGINILRTRDKLGYSEERYRNIFENVPVALLEVDVSGVNLYLKELLNLGIKDLKEYFMLHSKELDEALELFKILDVNSSALELCRAKNKEELINNVCKIIPSRFRRDYIYINLSLLEGLQKGEIFTFLCTLSGEERQVHLKWLTPPPPRGISNNDRIIIAILDITETKKLTETLKRSLEELKKSLRDTVELLSSIVEIKDPYISGHQKRVSELSCKIAQKLDLPSNDIEKIKVAGLLHDIGKIAIPGEILNKPGKLGELEFEIVKTHPKIGYDIIKKANSLYDIAEIILQHHERLDGSGYPKGLKGNEISLLAKILAVADVVEAMTSHRPYRPAFSTEDVIKELRENSNKLYDPQVVSACIEIIEK